MEINLNKKELLVAVKALNKTLLKEKKEETFFDKKFTEAQRKQSPDLSKLKLRRYQKSLFIEDLENVIQKFENKLY